MKEPGIVHESAAVVVVDKPHGWLTIPGRRGADDPRPVVARFLAERYGTKIWIVHRLDREVSGLVLFARNASAHRLLCGWFERHEVAKRYEAWSEGAPPAEGEQVWDGWLVPGRRRMHESPAPGKGKWSRTVARYLGTAEAGDLLRWEMLPETGRTHQLRCQASARGFPLAGDVLYGSGIPFAPDAIALRAVALTFAAGSEPDLAALGVPRMLRVEGLS